LARKKTNDEMLFQMPLDVFSGRLNGNILGVVSLFSLRYTGKEQVNSGCEILKGGKHHDRI
jgi:hypothetical protein